MVRYDLSGIPIDIERKFTTHNELRRGDRLVFLEQDPGELPDGTYFGLFTIS